jgi:hypothetical protein
MAGVAPRDTPPVNQPKPLVPTTPEFDIGFDLASNATSPEG